MFQKTPEMKRITVIYILIILSFSALWSQVPQKINYQAVIRNSSGEVVENKQVSLRISLHQGSAGGLSIYSETHQISTNKFGLVNLAIGAGESSQLFDDIEWGKGNGIWVNIELDIQGGSSFVPMGGMELLSVPYSMYAKEAASAPAVLQTMTDEQRISMIDIPVGMMILNTSTNKVNVYQSDGWHELGGEKIASPFVCGQFLVDSRDEQSYKTIKIGDQCWMAENINVGETKLGSVDMSDNEVIEKYCYDDMESKCDVYGGLYQWDELMDYSITESCRGICPEGWHIPSDGEVQELEIALGMSESTAALGNTWRGSNEGSKMAMGGESGYEALYSGRRVTGGLYSALDNYEYLYTSTQSGANAWRRCLRASDLRIGRYDTFPKTYGMSIRCVLNK